MGARLGQELPRLFLWTFLFYTVPQLWIIIVGILGLEILVSILTKETNSAARVMGAILGFLTGLSIASFLHTADQWVYLMSATGYFALPALMNGLRKKRRRARLTAHSSRAHC